jgi:putative transposase
MARPTRIDIENGWYHVTARGIERRSIFRADVDREHFLELLATAAERFRVLIHAYVLMDNHYHLVIQTPDANLSTTVQWINVSYSVWFNKRHDRVGPLFQGRFKSVPVEDSVWAYDLSLYVHLNPVMRRGHGLDKRGRKAEGRGDKAPDRVQVRARLEELRVYRWSSYRAYGGYVKAPEWLTTEEILSRARGTEARTRRRAYRTDARARLSGGMGDEMSDGPKASIAIGGAEFVEKVRALAKPGRENRGKRKYRARLTPDAAIALVEEVRGASYEDFMSKRGDWGRPLLLWCMRNYCGLSLREIGKVIGGTDYAAVQIMIARFERKAQTVRNLHSYMTTIKNTMLYVET